MLSDSLCGDDWELRAIGDLSAAPPAVRGRTIRARVPGCVHTALMAAGLIEDPLRGFAETTTQWIGRTDWEYRRIVRLNANFRAHQRVQLVLERADTAAMILVNGRPIASVANFHHAHRIDVGDALREGENELVVRFRGPLTCIDEARRQLGDRPVNGDWDPYVFLRRPAFSFGWDWGPKTPTTGLLGRVSLEQWDRLRIASVRPIVRRISPTDWLVDLNVELEAAAGEDFRAAACMRIAIERDGRALAQHEGDCQPLKGRLSVSLPVRDPLLWRPHALGEPACHSLCVWIINADGATIAHAKRSIGFRTIHVDSSPDEWGERLSVIVNGRAMFVRGVNWIPQSPFGDANPRPLLEAARAANVDLIRVWGGGTYESEEFYRVCDELGLLVWQDFPFACAMYPEEPPFPSLVQREATENISRLMAHPSLALWCGGNECVWAHRDWGFGARLQPGQTWGRAYYFEMLPRLVAELDPQRQYLPNTPFSAWAACDSARDECSPNDARCGTMHVWDVWGEGYRSVVPRFCAEFGHQSPPNIATLRETLPESELQIDSRAMVHLQRATGGNEKWYTQRMAEWFKSPSDFDEWHFHAQLLQARCLSLGIQWFRANSDRCRGAVVWQLNDVWAGHSWSLIDSAGRKKPAWYAVRRSFAPRLLTFQPIEGRLRLIAIDERGDGLRLDVCVRRVDFAGQTLAEQRFLSDARTGLAKFELSEDLISPVEPARELLVADGDGMRAMWFFARDRDLAYPEARIACRLATNEGRTRMMLKAKTLVRDLLIQADRIAPDAEVGENLLTLLPGEEAMVEWRSSSPITDEVLRTTGAIRCANSNVVHCDAMPRDAAIEHVVHERHDEERKDG
ncbi:MAG: glycoside hydrolase family 2 protein [Planctomycetes bacterium]|nr:glycoside hydrolase family 2 protein [Planctomycetota bacterium]